MPQSDISEVDEALRIGRTTRDSIISGIGSTQSKLRGFLTVAQILARDEELEWANNELDGYSSMELPTYRKSCYGNVKFSTGMKFQLQQSYEIPISMSIPKLEALIQDQKKDENISLAVRPVTSKKIDEIIGKPYSGVPTVLLSKSEISTILGGVENDLIKKLNLMISEITYGKNPKSIFEEFQNKVDKKLADSNPRAISALNKTYESLGASEDPERISQVSLACRRLIKHVADQVYPARSGKYTLNRDGETYELDLGDEKVFNRLTAHVDSINSSSKKHILNGLDLLRDFYIGEEGYANRGIHDEISNTDAKRLVLYTYLILGDIILEEEKSQE